VVNVFTLTSENGSQFIVSKSKDLEINLSQLYKDLSSQITIKGGGNNNTIQGNVSSEKLDELREYVIIWLTNNSH
jgi:alanyl-tRNA synthetase